MDAIPSSLAPLKGLQRPIDKTNPQLKMEMKEVITSFWPEGGMRNLLLYTWKVIFKRGGVDLKHPLERQIDALYQAKLNSDPSNLQAPSADNPRKTTSQNDELIDLLERFDRLTPITQDDFLNLARSIQNQWCRSRFCEQICPSHFPNLICKENLADLDLDEEANYRILYSLFSQSHFMDLDLMAAPSISFSILTQSYFEEEADEMLQQTKFNDKHLASLLKRRLCIDLIWERFKSLLEFADRIKVEDRDKVIYDLFKRSKWNMVPDLVRDLQSLKLSAPLLGDIIAYSLTRPNKDQNPLFNLDLRAFGYTPEERKAIFLRIVKVMPSRFINDVYRICERWGSTSKEVDLALTENPFLDLTDLTTIVRRLMPGAVEGIDLIKGNFKNIMESLPKKTKEEQAVTVHLLCTLILESGDQFYYILDRTYFEMAVQLYYSDFLHLLPPERILHLFKFIMSRCKVSGREWTSIKVEDLFKTRPGIDPEAQHPLNLLVEYLVDEELLEQFICMFAKSSENHPLLHALLKHLDLSKDVNFRVLKMIIKEADAKGAECFVDKLADYKLTSFHCLTLLKRAIAEVDTWGMVYLYCRLHDYPLMEHDRLTLLKVLCSKHKLAWIKAILKALPSLGYSKEEVRYFLLSVANSIRILDEEATKTLFRLLEVTEQPEEFRMQIFGLCADSSLPLKLPSLYANIGSLS